MKYLSNLLISIDQLGNVIAGGNPDNTISSRIGYYTKNKDESKIPLHWKLFRNIINFTFFPIDGNNHCREAYLNDAGEKFDPGTNNIIVSILAFIILPSCVTISLLLYSLYALGIVSPRKINRNKNIKDRLIIAEAKLNGALSELNNHKVEVNKELDKVLTKTQKTLHLVNEKIDGLLNVNRRLESFKKKKQNKK